MMNHFELKELIKNHLDKIERIEDRIYDIELRLMQFDDLGELSFAEEAEYTKLYTESEELESKKDVEKAFLYRDCYLYQARYLEYLIVEYDLEYWGSKELNDRVPKMHELIEGRF